MKPPLRYLPSCLPGSTPDHASALISVVAHGSYVDPIFGDEYNVSTKIVSPLTEPEDDPANDPPLNEADNFPADATPEQRGDV